MSERCDLYMKEGVTMKKATTLRIGRIRIARHIKPRLGRMKVTDIGRADIERLMVDVGSGRIRGEATPHTRGGIHAASRVVSRVPVIAAVGIEGFFPRMRLFKGSRQGANVVTFPLRRDAQRGDDRGPVDLTHGSPGQLRAAETWGSRALGSLGLDLVRPRSDRRSPGFRTSGEGPWSPGLQVDRARRRSTTRRRKGRR
ncbi:hypothetical protein LG306_00555 [Brevundimonas vesicularis]